MGKIAHASVGTTLEQTDWEEDSTHTIGGTADQNIVIANDFIKIDETNKRLADTSSGTQEVEHNIGLE